MVNPKHAMPIGWVPSVQRFGEPRETVHIWCGTSPDPILSSSDILFQPERGAMQAGIGYNAKANRAK
jgi:hypothetical protein